MTRLLVAPQALPATRGRAWFTGLAGSPSYLSCGLVVEYAPDDLAERAWFGEHSPFRSDVFVESGSGERLHTLRQGTEGHSIGFASIHRSVRVNWSELPGACMLRITDEQLGIDFSAPFDPTGASGGHRR